MSRPRSSRLAPSLLLALVVVPPVQASTLLDVTGEVVAAAPELEVRVRVANSGQDAAEPLTVVGELLGQRREARVTRGVPPGGEASVILGFRAEGARAGVHALALLLEHPVDGPDDAAGRPAAASQRAYVLVTLGPRPAEAVALEVECEDGDACTTVADVSGEIGVRLRSADGAAHGVRVRVLTARGLRPAGEPVETRVPPSDHVSVAVPVVRSGAPRGSLHGVIVLAETTDDAEPLRTVAASTTVAVEADRSLVRRLRAPLLILGLALLALAVFAERRRELSPADPTPSEDPGP